MVPQAAIMQSAARHDGLRRRRDGKARAAAGADRADVGGQRRGRQRPRAGERIVLDGRQNLRPGGTVRRARRRGAGRGAAGAPAGAGSGAGGGAVAAPSAARGHGAMNLSELFIRRPVMTVLLNAGHRAGRRHRLRRASRSPRCRATTRRSSTSSAQLPGASPETMATSVALPLEKQFSTIPGLNVISSTSTLGNTSLTLEFDAGPRHRRRRGRRAGGAAARAARAAAGDDHAAVVPQGQPGRCAGAVHRADLAVDGRCRS